MSENDPCFDAPRAFDPDTGCPAGCECDHCFQARLRREGAGSVAPRSPGAGEFSIGGKLWPGLSKLIEEAGETGDLLPELILLRALGRIGQVAGKVIGNEGRPEHWDGSNLPVRLAEEIGDLLAAAEFVIDHNGLDRAAVVARRAAKLELYEDWHHERLRERKAEGEA